MLFRTLLVALGVVAFAIPGRSELLPDVRRILFLGDSITYAGLYVDYFEAFLFLNAGERRIEVMNVGLPSETASGLSEPGHADGKFPRPNVHERLDRVLEKTKPDLVFACYGMNDGIYKPFAEERFEKFRAGILRVREKVTAANAKIIHITPPTFDPAPLKGKTSPSGAPNDARPFEHYNEVLDRYSAWLNDQKSKGWEVVDLHGAMNQELAERRTANPDFRFAGDGVHCDAAGHWIFTREILRHLGQRSENFTADARHTELLKLVHRRGRILTDSWLNEIGHLRPGMSKGRPLPEAIEQASALEAQIRAQVAAPRE